NFKNQENQDFKSWKSSSEKPNLAAKAHWTSCTSLNEPISRANGSQDQVLEKNGPLRCLGADPRVWK
ncbi:hypothetical protein J1N35_014992, partial [Gossypium stocksii]